MGQRVGGWLILTLFNQMVSVLSILALLCIAKFEIFLPEVTFLILVLSAITFTAYGIDKAAAIFQLRRTPEVVLHLASLLGGWPGAVIAQQLFQHKTRKPKFLAVFWMTAAMNCLALGAISI